jgi:predicted MFS family arabinose efflux permease
MVDVLPHSLESIEPAPQPRTAHDRSGHVPWRPILLATAVALAFADASIVVLGLPAIYGELDTTVVQASWVITLYAVVITAVAAGLGLFARRLRPYPVALCGLILFAAGSALSGVAPVIGLLYAGRAVQGAGAAMLLVTSLTILGLLTGSNARGHAWWITAATVGAATGPAIGGVLTQVFAWRAIFFVQVPAALLAIVAVATPVVRAARADDAEGTVRPTRDRRALTAHAGEVLLFAALVGALFLGVLLLVVVWGYEPVAGAAVVSALPLASLAVRPLTSRLRPMTAAVAGAVSLASGLAGLALLPSVSGWLAALAFAFCGAGMGLALSVLGPALLSGAVHPIGTASRSVAARHLGLVLGLLVIAPLLGTNLQHRASDAASAGTARMLEAQLPLRQKIPLAWALRNEIVKTPEGEVPDLDAVFTAQGARTNPAMAQAREDLVGTIQSILTRAFRSAFLVAALLALAALLPLAALAHWSTRAAAAGARGAGGAGRWRAGVAAGLVAACVALAGVVFVAGEGAAGASDFGTYTKADPCTASPLTYPGKGIDGAVQRIALSGLNGAACDLGTTREELVLSLDPKGDVGDVHWDRDTAAQAVKSGTSRAIDDAVDRGSLPGWAGRVLGFVVDRAPLGWLLQRLPIN